MDKFFENESSKKIVKIILAATLVVILIVALVLIFSKNEYSSIEKQMVKNAKEYISKNNINVTNQEYVFIGDLAIEDGVELCSKASGVIVTNIGGSIKYYPYLKCFDYESDVLNNTKSYIELNGSEVELVNLGTLYFDKGYIKKKDNIKVEEVGEVPNEVGAYTINYVITKDGKQRGIVKRIVVVSAVDTEVTLSGLDNKDVPNINLKGEQELTLLVNSKYIEPGYTAYDYEDGKISRNVKVEPNKISTDKPGKQEITYTVTNSKGKTYSIKRVVKVVQKIADLQIDLTALENGAATNESQIEIKVFGNGFEKMVLPDGTSSASNINVYTVKANGNYTFKVIDYYGNTIYKTITIDNIDSEPPKGSCVVEMLSGGNVVKVLAEDDRGIKSIDYILNGKETGFLARTKYKTNEKIETAEAVIKDVAGNTTRISCEVNGISSIYTFNYDNDKPFIQCDSYTDVERKELEDKLSQAIALAGYGTRAGVVEAARFLVGGLNYKIKYMGPKNSSVDPDKVIGRYNKVGLNIANSTGWGCSVHGYTQGLDCTNFVYWAFKNGGVKIENVYSETDNYKSSEVADQIRPGDLLLSPCYDSCRFESKYSHVGIVIGVDAKNIYVAEETTEDIDALVISEYQKDNMPTKGKFSVVKLYNYSSDGNLTNMWN